MATDEKLQMNTDFRAIYRSNGKWLAVNGKRKCKLWLSVDSARVKQVPILILWVLFISLECCAAIQPQSQAQAVIKVNEEMRDPYAWDFGKVKEGGVLKHDFILKNETKKNLKIERINTSCDCTISQAKKKMLVPQESTVIEVSFNTQGYSGQVSQFVYVNTDNPDNPIIKITIKADVESSKQREGG